MLDILDLEQLDDRLFRGRTPSPAPIRVFGGQVAAQALVAAGRTCPPERSVHSLHSYFLRPGDPARPIIYEVDPIRDGGSFTTRRVVARQRGEAIFHLSASFQLPRVGELHHQRPSTDVQDPENLPSTAQRLSGLDERSRAWIALMQERNPIELRFVTEPARAKVSRGERPPPVEQVWLRCTEALPDDPLIHACVATFTSDMLLLGSVLSPHGRIYDDPGMLAVSLDHAVWFHMPFRADDWYLYDTVGTWAGGGRGLCQGLMFDRSRRLVATVMQEGMISYRDPLGR